MSNSGTRRPGRMGGEDIGDTSSLVRRGGDGMEVAQLEAGSAPAEVSVEIVELLQTSLKATPGRADLRMMLFEVLSRLQMKRELFKSAEEAAADDKVRPTLDWLAVERLLQDLAPYEPMPAAVKAAIEWAQRVARHATGGPAGPAAAAVPAAATPVAGAVRHKRFSDVAVQVAGEALNNLARSYAALRSTAGFFESFASATSTALKRPTPLVQAGKLGRAIGGAVNIWLKREDLRPQLAEVENAVAQVWFAKAMHKRVLVTGNDQDDHALAVARVAARFSMPCVLFMRPEEHGQKPELVRQLQQLGCDLRSSVAEQVLPFDPREAALRHWQTNLGEAHLALSLGTGPRPYPVMVNDFRSLIGRDVAAQFESQVKHPKNPAFVAAAYSQGDTVGFMLPQLNREGIELVCVEPPPGEPPETQATSRVRAFHGSRREHAWLRASGRVSYAHESDERAASLCEQLSLLEGISIGLEDGRAVAHVEAMARGLSKLRDVVILVAAP